MDEETIESTVLFRRLGIADSSVDTIISSINWPL